MAEIKVRFRAIVGDEDLAVLIRAHGAGVNVQIRVKFLVLHAQTALLQEPAERCGTDALAKAGDDTAGDKDEFGLFLCHRISSSIFAFLNSFPYKPL